MLQNQLALCVDDDERLKLLLDNTAVLFGDLQEEQHEQAKSCACPEEKMHYDEFWGQATCTQCGRTNNYIPITAPVKQGMYRCVHYLHSLLKAYNLGERIVDRQWMYIIHNRWQRAGRPPPTKRTLQRVLRTKREKLLRPVLRSWRQVAYKLDGFRPPPFNRKTLDAIHILFLRFHRAYIKLGYYELRKSFLNFPFLMRRILELLGLDDRKQHWPGLSGDDKFVAHYTIFAALCRHLKIPLIVNTF